MMCQHDAIIDEKIEDIEDIENKVKGERKPTQGERGKSGKWMPTYLRTEVLTWFIVLCLPKTHKKHKPQSPSYYYFEIK